MCHGGGLRLVGTRDGFVHEQHVGIAAVPLLAAAKATIPMIAIFIRSAPRSPRRRGRLAPGEAPRRAPRRGWQSGNYKQRLPHLVEEAKQVGARDAHFAPPQPRHRRRHGLVSVVVATTPPT